MLNKRYYNQDAGSMFLAPESVDLFVTHPPYFNTHSEEYGNPEGQLQNTADRETFINNLIDVIKHMEMALKPNGTILILFPTDSNIYKIIEQINIKTNLRYGPMFFWDFTNSPHVKNVEGGENNIILNLHKGAQRTNTDYKLDSYTLVHPWVFSDKLKSNSHVAFIGDSAPEIVYEKLIGRYSWAGDVVADIMGGTGSALGVAKRMGRHTVYNDISKEQIKLAKIIIDNEQESEVDLSRKEVIDLMTKEIINMNIRTNTIPQDQIEQYIQENTPELNWLCAALFDMLVKNGVIVPGSITQ